MADLADVLPDASNETDAHELRRRAEAIIADPQFAKSPLLVGLLRFLVDRTIDGSAASLKSYTIAVDCLGRPSSGSVDDDAYARVVVGRLRKALREHHEAHGRVRGGLRVRSGSYEVQLAGDEALGSPEVVDDITSIATVPRTAAIDARRLAGTRIVAALILLAMTMMVGFLYLQRQERDRWKTVDYPTVGIAPRMEGLAPDEAGEIQHHMEDRLAQMPGIRLLEPRRVPDFKIVALHAGDEISPEGLMVKVVQTKDDRVVFARLYSSPPQVSTSTINTAVDDVAGPIGAIHGFNRRRLDEADSPYRCWLAFTGHLATVRTVDGSALRSCSAKWFAANPNHPMAVSLHAWAQVDEANRMISDADRIDLLRSTEGEVADALVLNPDVGALHLANLRLQAALHNREGVLISAKQLVGRSHQNAAFPTYAAMFLAFWRNPDARLLLDRAEGSGHASPYTAVGRFALAIAADDPAAASAHLAGLKKVQASQPALQIIEAAYLSRTGKVGEARSLLRQFCRRGWFIGMTPKTVMRRLPLDDTMRSQLSRWLQPLTRSDKRIMECST